MFWTIFGASCFAFVLTFKLMYHLVSFSSFLVGWTNSSSIIVHENSSTSNWCFPSFGTTYEDFFSSHVFTHLMSIFFRPSSPLKLCSVIPFLDIFMNWLHKGIPNSLKPVLWSDWFHPRISIFWELLNSKPKLSFQIRPSTSLGGPLEEPGPLLVTVEQELFIFIAV